MILGENIMGTISWEYFDCEYFNFGQNTFFILCHIFFRPHCSQKTLCPEVWWANCSKMSHLQISYTGDGCFWWLAWYGIWGFHSPSELFCSLNSFARTVPCCPPLKLTWARWVGDGHLKLPVFNLNWCIHSPPPKEIVSPGSCSCGRLSRCPFRPVRIVD